MNSAFPKISQPVAADARCSRINGVRPTAAAIVVAVNKDGVLQNFS
jgi:hypothetical protein